MRLGLRMLLPVAALGAAALLGGAAHAPIVAFGRIQPGAWQLRALDKSAPDLRLCVEDGYELIQLRHPGAACSRFVLTNNADSATVHYTCTGSGYGRTTIKVETGQLIRVDSQGLMNQAPFQVSLEGRRVGTCAREQVAR